MSDCPKFTLIFPLYDDRSQALKAVELWTAQRTAEAQFELIIVDAGQRKLASKILPMLGANDRIIECRSQNEATLYNIGARAARSKWIVFSESHVLPAQDCVESLVKALLRDDFDAATLGSAHVVRSRFSDIDSRLFGVEQSAVRELGLWRCVGLRGFVTRRELFEKLGGFNEDYFRFCETVYAIQLDRASYRLIELPKVIVAHVDTDSLAELARAMYFGQLGFCRFWEDDPTLASKYFGGTMKTHCGQWTNSMQARALFTASVKHLRYGQFRGATALLKQGLVKLPIAFAGGKAHAIYSLCRTMYESALFYGSLALWNQKGPPELAAALTNRYQRIRAGFARLGAIRFQSETDQSASRQRPARELTLDANRLQELSCSFYPSEFWMGQSYCWSRPAALLKLPLRSGQYLVSLDIRPTGQLSVRQPRFFVEGKLIRRENTEETNGCFNLRFACGDNPTITWTCVPFEPRLHGLMDQRKLGIAIIGVNAVACKSNESTLARAA